MAAPRSTCTVEKQRIVIRLLWSEGVKPSEIYRRMNVSYTKLKIILGGIPNIRWDVDTNFQLKNFTFGSDTAGCYASKMSYIIVRS